MRGQPGTGGEPALPARGRPQGEEGVPKKRAAIDKGAVASGLRNHALMLNTRYPVTEKKEGKPFLLRGDPENSKNRKEQDTLREKRKSEEHSSLNNNGWGVHRARFAGTQEKREREGVDFRTPERT